MIRGFRGLALAGLPVALLAGPVLAQELKIGLASEPTSIDPHFHNLGPNNALRRHIFEGLVAQNAEQIKAGTVGGVLFLSHNIQSPQQLKTLTGYLQRARSDIPVLLAVDQDAFRGVDGFFPAGRVQQGGGQAAR